MAVLQISRIQLRRGKANSGTGIPQLASGELAWALDTQQLFIGNGSVAEGAPAVGNTKILTENDLKGQGSNILDLIQHIYKVNDETVQTGPSAASPIIRSLQDRFDDRVTTLDFGTERNSITDDTAALQRAINQLFLNPASQASVDSADGAKTRVVLEMPAGKFKTTGTLYIPSYATIVGAGKGKTIIEYTGTGPAIQFVNDSSTIAVPSTLSTTLYTTQPRYITLANLTVYVKNATETALQFDAVRDSLFNNIEIKGSWAGIFSSTSIGIALNALSDVVTCERNTFTNITIVGFQTAVYAPYDIARNTFDNLYINNVYDGFILGARFLSNTANLQEVSGTTVGEQYGPRNTIITNSVLGDISDGIKRYALFVGKGTNNSINDSRFVNVGHNGQRAENLAIVPQVYFTSIGNTLKNIASDRFKVGSNPTTTIPYIAEAAGTVDFNSFGTAYAALSGGSQTPLTAFKLPLSVGPTATPRGKTNFVIDYTFKSSTNDNFARCGKLYVTADSDNGVVQLADDYNFAGSTNASELILDFKAVLIDAANVDYTNPSVQSMASLAIKYSNLPNGGLLYYSYSSSTFDSGIIPTV